MTMSSARKKANRKWDESNRDRYWQCPLRFPAADKQVIFARADQMGISVSEYIRGLVYADLEDNNLRMPGKIWGTAKLVDADGSEGDGIGFVGSWYLWFDFIVNDYKWSAMKVVTMDQAGLEVFNDFMDKAVFATTGAHPGNWDFATQLYWLDNHEIRANASWFDISTSYKITDEFDYVYDFSDFEDNCDQEDD